MCVGFNSSVHAHGDPTAQKKAATNRRPASQKQPKLICPPPACTPAVPSFAFRPHNRGPAHGLGHQEAEPLDHRVHLLAPLLQPLDRAHHRQGTPEPELRVSLTGELGGLGDATR